MEQTFAVLDASNTVINIIVADQAFVDAHYPGSPVLHTPGGIGSTYDHATGSFTEPPVDA